MRVALPVSSMLFLLVPRVAAGQVTGTVIDSASGRPVANAHVYFGPQGEVLTGAGGEFRIERASPDDTMLAVRRIGFVPRVIAVPAGVQDVGQVMLRPVATRLDQIEVEAEEVRIYPQLADFYRRRQSGFTGDFFTREDIERAGVRRTSELASRSERIEMDCPRQSLGDDCIVRNRRGRDIRMAGTGRRAQTGDRGESGAAYNLLRCEMTIFVDGMQSKLLIDEIDLDRVAAMEIYSGPATTPTQFGSGRCGVVAIWTTGTRGSD